MSRPRRWAGWIDDGRGALHVTASRAPGTEAQALLFELRDAVVAAMQFAERQAGRWEDDGGAAAPEPLDGRDRRGRSLAMTLVSRLR